jgi:uncharacterized membrane protein YecN with MAPEG domain
MIDIHICNVQITNIELIYYLHNGLIDAKLNQWNNMTSLLVHLCEHIVKCPRCMHAIGYTVNGNLCWVC